MEIPKRYWASGWDGYSIYLTKNCDGCQYHREIDGIRLCGEGVAWKSLDENNNPRKCAKLKSTREHKRSIEFLDKFIASYKLGQPTTSNK